MDIRCVNSFISGLLNVTGMLGMTSMQRKGLSKRTKLRTDNDVNIIIGLVGDIRGSVVFSMQEATARNIASTMMGGMPVDKFDMMPKSALCELANMVSGNSVSLLEQQKALVNITPPTLINGKNMITMISQVETLVVEFEGQEGKIEMNVATED
ncbi:MAG: chemotaxis protein CheX [Firmicutes bacterium HGW-Firmicutes-15]|nr:MAG: chemotaxis protein CheX [Firmicutes bacterium HGW-Firmicutes-15]